MRLESRMWVRSHRALWAGKGRPDFTQILCKATEEF